MHCLQAITANSSPPQGMELSPLREHKVRNTDACSYPVLNSPRLQCHEGSGEHFLNTGTISGKQSWYECRADREELQQLLAAARELPEPPRAMFVHADIAGARYNTRQQAHVGLGTEAFPSDIPTYSGHYHLPHTVPNTSITYVGSPFQCTLCSRMAPGTSTPGFPPAILV